MKKEEKDLTTREAADRKRRIALYEKEMREEEERCAKALKVSLLFVYKMFIFGIQEKSELYDKLQEGKVQLTHKDDTPVEFLVDFNMKKRKYEDEAERLVCSFVLCEYSEFLDDIKKNTSMIMSTDLPVPL